MAKKKNYLDELEQYQQKQYLPHTHHIQNGQLPFATRQLMKQGIKKYIYLLFIAIPLSIGPLFTLKERLHLSPETMGVIGIVWVGLIVLAFALLVLAHVRGASKNKVSKGNKGKKKKRR